MEKKFRGDTFLRSYSIEFEDGIYTFQAGDKIKIAFCKYNGNKYLLKEKILPIGEDEIDITFTGDEMSTLEIGEYILEVEFTTNNFVITQQEKIHIDEDFIYGEE